MMRLLHIMLAAKPAGHSCYQRAVGGVIIIDIHLPHILIQRLNTVRKILLFIAILLFPISFPGTFVSLLNRCHIFVYLPQMLEEDFIVILQRAGSCWHVGIAIRMRLLAQRVGILLLQICFLNLIFFVVILLFILSLLIFTFDRGGRPLRFKEPYKPLYEQI